MLSYRSRKLAPRFLSRNLRLRMALAALALCGVGCAPLALAGVAASVEGGSGQSVDVVGLGIAWTDVHAWRGPWSTELNLSLLGRVDHWHGTEENPVVSNLWDVSATPVVRIQPAQPKGWFAFFDVGIGVHLISETRINEHRQFSTVFQFGEFFGPGVRFGDRAQYELSFRVQHVSNGNIKEPNNGLTFHTIAFQYRF
jgi:lipid A 3-O-deacylase